MPRVVSIGPRFIGREDLVPMEKVKSRCMLSLIDRVTLSPPASRAPSSPAEILDACGSRSHFSFRCSSKLRPKHGYDNLELPDLFKNLRSPIILDLVRIAVNRRQVGEPYVVDTRPQQQRPKLNRCALRLLTAGVTILPEDKDSTGFSALSWLSDIFVVNSGKHMDNIPEAEGLDFYFDFYNNKLEIKQLHITKTTKAKWCNLIAMEHHQKIQCIQTTYRPGSIYSSNSIWAALIFNDLICSADDVQFLRDKKIIVDHINMSNQELMEFFRKIPLGFDYRAVVDSNNYTQMVDNINNFSKSYVIKRIWSTVWNSFTYRQEWLLRFLNRNYNFVATVISLCTVVQTIYAIIAYQFPKK
ncbi:hypothetical protein P8452_64866 [Trifolium repens]|nr:hypothetical protein P8452_64866 [Trifolium repens]